MVEYAGALTRNQHIDKPIQKVVRHRERSAVRGKGPCRYCNRRIDLVQNLPAPTVRRHIVIRRLLLSRKRHPEDWTRLVDSQKRVVCPGSGQPPKLRSSEDQPAIASDTQGGAESKGTPDGHGEGAGNRLRHLSS